MAGLLVGLNAPWQTAAPAPVRRVEAAARGRSAPRHCEATLYLPLADDQGRRFSESEWQERWRNCVRPFGGATLGEPREGCWIGSGRRLCREWVRPVVISFAPERIEEFRRAARAAGRKLGQEAMYARFEEPGVDLLFVEESRGRRATEVDVQGRDPLLSGPC